MTVIECARPEKAGEPLMPGHERIVGGDKPMIPRSVRLEIRDDPKDRRSDEQTTVVSNPRYSSSRTESKLSEGIGVLEPELTTGRGVPLRDRPGKWHQGRVFAESQQIYRE